MLVRRLLERISPATLRSSFFPYVCFGEGCSLHRCAAASGHTVRLQIAPKTGQKFRLLDSDFREFLVSRNFWRLTPNCPERRRVESLMGPVRMSYLIALNTKVP